MQLPSPNPDRRSRRRSSSPGARSNALSSRLGGTNASLATTGWHRAASCRYAEGRPIAPRSLGKGREKERRAASCLHIGHDRTSRSKQGQAPLAGRQPGGGVRLSAVAAKPGVSSAVREQRQQARPGAEVLCCCSRGGGGRRAGRTAGALLLCSDTSPAHWPQVRKGTPGSPAQRTG